MGMERGEELVNGRSRIDVSLACCFACFTFSCNAATRCLNSLFSATIFFISFAVIIDYFLSFYSAKIHVFFYPQK
jgi:hypothetical protein